MQSWSLDRKIKVSQLRILEWYQKWNGKVYISFSGGKDSTVLADLAARVCKVNNYKLILVFCDTGLEYPEIRNFIITFKEWLENTYKIEVKLEKIYPIKYDKKQRKYIKTNFKQVLIDYGYPLISKEASSDIEYGRKALLKKDISKINRYINGVRKNAQHEEYTYNKLSKLAKKVLYSKIPVSNKCCNIMKKIPAKYYEKQTGNHVITAEMAEESIMRKQHYLESGCNGFNLTRPKSTPLGFWVTKDILKYLKDFKIPYCSVYGEIKEDENGIYCTGEQRTGCMFCMFGVHREKELNKFQRMSLKTEWQSLYNYCINGGEFYEDGMWKPNAQGLGLGYILDFIEVPYTVQTEKESDMN